MQYPNRALALCAAASLLVGAAAPSFGDVVRKRKPIQTQKTVTVPEPLVSEDGRFVDYRNGSTGMRVFFEDTTLEYRLPADPDSGIRIHLQGPGQDREWHLSSSFEEDLRRASERVRQAVDETSRRGDPPLGEAYVSTVLGDELLAADLRSLEDVAAEIDRLVPFDAITTGFEGVRRDAQARLALEMEHTAKDGCLGRIGTWLFLAGSTSACVIAMPASFGVHGFGCLALGAGTAAAFGAACSECGFCAGSGRGGGGGTCCAGTPYRCCCDDLGIGDACLCRCPGEPCCDWPDERPGLGHGNGSAR